MLFMDGDILEEDDLPDEILEWSQHSGSLPVAPIHLPAPESVGGLKEAVKETTLILEKQYISRALEETGGNVTQAAKRLQISRKSLQNKMKEFGLRDDG